MRISCEGASAAPAAGDAAAFPVLPTGAFQRNTPVRAMAARARAIKVPAELLAGGASSSGLAGPIEMELSRGAMAWVSVWFGSAGWDNGPSRSRDAAAT